MRCCPKDTQEWAYLYIRLNARCAEKNGTLRASWICAGDLLVGRSTRESEMSELTPGLVGLIIAGGIIIIISVAALLSDIIELFRDIFGKRRAR